MQPRYLNWNYPRARIKGPEVDS